MNALVYYRVSTDEQAQEGKSLETQQKLCLRWARDNSYSVVGEYHDDGKSATSINRPALKELLARCQEDRTIKAVIIQDTDRLARNTLDHLTIKALLQKLNINLISISQPMIDSSPEGNLIDTIIASVNAFQSQITGRKTSKVLEQKALNGWYPGGTPPLGYRNGVNLNPESTLDNKIIELDPEKAPYIKVSFEKFSTGQFSAQKIAEDLMRQGLRSETGGVIHDSVLLRALQNPFYIGKFRWKGKIYEGKHPHLVSDELFELCQKVLESHNHNASRLRKHNFLLRGFVYCYICNRRLVGEKHQKKSGKVFEYYFCPTCKKGTFIDKNSLEQQVEKQFLRIAISKEYSNEILEEAKVVLNEIKSTAFDQRILLTNRKSKLESAMREAEDDRYLRNTITQETFDRIYPRYEQQLKEIEGEATKLDSDNSDKLKILQRLCALAEDIGATYQEADPAIKRGYLDLFWKGFDIKDGLIVRSRLQDSLKPLLEDSSVRIRQLPGYCNL